MELNCGSQSAKMELNVNNILSTKITKITNSLLPPGFKGDVRSVRIMQESLAKVINLMGYLSAHEQGLSKIVTSADKLRTADTHTLYLYTDGSANEGKGEVQGMLKVGPKHLFLRDKQDKMREVEPLCVLDFFVLGKCQRLGIGKMLFEYMLEDMNTSAEQLAVDGPSEKMVAFLAKNYGMSPLTRHSNNFAVSARFFDLEPSKFTATTKQQTGAGRYTAHKPQSSIGSIIHME